MKYAFRIEKKGDKFEADSEFKSLEFAKEAAEKRRQEMGEDFVSVDFYRSKNRGWEKIEE